MQKQMRILAVVMTGLLLSAATAAGATAADRVYKVKKHASLTYIAGEKVDRYRHRLDVYQPVGVKDAPVLMFVHGGAWRFGSKAFHPNIGNTFARRGIVTVSINYRLTPRVKHPEHVRDVARAFAWIKKNITNYGGNPKRVFLCGHSAGAHLVALLATNEKYLGEAGHKTDAIAGVIAVSGPYRVRSGGLFAGVFPRELVDDASPALHVDDAQPPFLVMYAQHDMHMLDVLARDFARRLKKHSSPVTLLEVKARDHSSIIRLIGIQNDPATEAMLKFVATHAKAGT